MVSGVFEVRYWRRARGSGSKATNRDEGGVFVGPSKEQMDGTSDHAAQLVRKMRRAEIRRG